MKKGFVVAIDGPAGAGKSTVSRLLAEQLGGRLLDTGAMYRSVAYLSLRQGVSTPAAFGEIARKLVFSASSDGHSLLVNGEDLGKRIRTNRVSKLASFISKFAVVRSVLTRAQRRLAKKWSQKLPVVVEGRDIGTVVFPDVEFKFFVTADPLVRARRRHRQLKKQGSKPVSLKKVLAENEKRDLQDSERRLAPLRCPKDAIVVDTSAMSVNQVVRFMREHIKGHLQMIGH